MLTTFYHIKGVGEGWGGGGGAGGARAPPPFQKWGGAQVGLCPPPPHTHTLLGRANVLISLFAHIL